MQRMGVFDAVMYWNPLIPAFSPKLLLGEKGSAIAGWIAPVHPVGWVEVVARNPTC